MTTVFIPNKKETKIESIYFLKEVDRHRLRWITFTAFLWTILLSILTAHWYGAAGFWLNFFLTFPTLRKMGHDWYKNRIMRRGGWDRVEDPLNYQTKNW